MREIGKRGGKTRATQFTATSQRAARRAVSSESCQRNGAKGAQRTIELHGHRLLFGRLRPPGSESHSIHRARRSRFFRRKYGNSVS